MEQSLQVARKVMNFESDKEVLNFPHAAARKVLPAAWPD